MDPVPRRRRPGQRREAAAYEETVLFSSPLVRVGAFRCRPQYPRFSDTGPIHDHLIVFPRTPVLITHLGGPTVVADPCTVMLYNRSQEYRRAKLSDRGDLCEWFAFDRQVLSEALSPFDPQAAERAGRPFSRTHGPSDPLSFYLQRRLVERLARGVPVEPLLVEETLFGVLRRAVSGVYEGRPGGRAPRRDSTVRAHRDLVEDTKSLLNRRYAEDLRLADIARRVNSSPYHLGRVFRAAAGTTLHAYRNQIRLRVSLEHILAGHDDLSGLAHDLGYSSHSHFGAAFRAAFGVAPSVARREVPSPAGVRAGF